MAEADIEKIVEIGARAMYEELKTDPRFSQMPPWPEIDDGWRDNERFKARALLSALTAAGYAVVPREPTDAMCDKGENIMVSGTLLDDLDSSPSGAWAAAKGCYRAMVEAFSPVKGSE